MSDNYGVMTAESRNREISRASEEAAKISIDIYFGNGSDTSNAYAREKILNKRVFKSFKPLNVSKILKKNKVDTSPDYGYSYYVDSNRLIMSIYFFALEIRNNLDKIQKINPSLIDVYEIWGNTVKDTETACLSIAKLSTEAFRRYGDRISVETVLKELPSVLEVFRNLQNLSRELKKTLRMVKDIEKVDEASFINYSFSHTGENLSKIQYLNRAVEQVMEELTSVN